MIKKCPRCNSTRMRVNNNRDQTCQKWGYTHSNNKDATIKVYGVKE